MSSIENFSSMGHLARAVYADLTFRSNGAEQFQTNDTAVPDALAESLADRYTVQAIHNDPLTGAYAVLFLDTQTQQQTLAIRGTEGAGDVLADLHLLVGIPAWMSLQYQSLVSKIEQWQVQGLIGAQTSITGHSLGGYLAAAVKSYYPSSFGATYTFNAPGLGGALGSVAQFFQNAFGITPSLSQVYGLRGSAGLSFIAGTGAQIGQTIPVEIEPAAGFGLANHSIARISQSLAVFGLLAKLDSQLSLAQANQLLAAASPQSGNSLENLVFAIDRTILGATAPASTGDDQALYTRLNALQDSPTFQTLAGKLKIEPTHSAEASKTDFAAFLSLQAGAGFSLRLKDPADAASVTKLQTANPTVHEQWLADKNLRNQGSDLSKLNFTDTYLNDRSAYANRLIERNIKDIGGILVGNQNLRFYDASTNTQILVGAGSSLRSNIIFGDGNANTVEGGAIADRLYGGAGSDTLDGKGGNDHLEGGKDADTYQFSGQAGSGWGHDTIVDSDGQGAIQVNGNAVQATKQVARNVWTSADDLSVFTLGGAPDALGRQDLIIGQRNSASSQQVHSTITVKGWKEGDLGISLAGAVAPPVPARAVTGESSSIVETVVFNPSDYWRGNELVGGEGGDLINGSLGNDVIYGGRKQTSIPADSGGDGQARDGKNLILGLGGADRIYGGNDRDVIISGGSLISGIYGFSTEVEKVRNGGDGDVWHASYSGWWQYENMVRNREELTSPDVIKYFLQNPVYGGLARAQTFDGTGDYVSGAGGNDFVAGSLGSDVLDGGQGDDEIYGRAGSDVILGGEGNDRLFGSFALYDGADYDQWLFTSPEWWVSNEHSAPINLSAGDFIDGGAGNDYILGSFGADVLLGGRGDDQIHALGINYDFQSRGLTIGDDNVYAGAGNDLVTLGNGRNYVEGGAGNDLLVVYQNKSHGRNELRGDEGNDVLIGGSAADLLLGGFGDDELWGDAGDDALVGGSGHDYLSGEKGNDDLVGDEGNDTLDGGDGNDVLWGGDGNDTLRGGEGNDRLIGGAGADWFEGGGGDDTYVFDAFDFGAGINRSGILTGGVIRDTSGKNTIELLNVSLQPSGSEGGFVTFSGASIRRSSQASAGEADLQLFLGDASNGSTQTVRIEGALRGSVNNFRLVNSSPVNSEIEGAGQQIVDLNVRTLVRTQLQEQVVLTTVRENELALGGALADELTVSHRGTTVNAGLGADVIRNRADGTVLEIELGDGGKVLEGGLQWGSQASGDTGMRIRLGEGLQLSDARLMRVRNEGVFADPAAESERVILKLSGPQASQAQLTYIELKDDYRSQLGSGNAPIFLLEDIQGQQLTWAELEQRGVLVSTDTEADDVLVGTGADDLISSGAGNDSVDAHQGDDVIAGGTGANDLNGGLGMDTYRIAAGSQNQIIESHELDAQSGPQTPASRLVFEGQTNWDGVTLSRIQGGNDLRLLWSDGTQVVLHDALLMAQGWSLELAEPDAPTRNLADWLAELHTAEGGWQIVGDGFADSIAGTAGRDLLQGLEGDDTLLGAAGADILIAGHGDDVLHGGEGDDWLEGGDGRDRYFISLGDGHDQILDTSGLTEIYFGAGLNASEMQVSRVGDSSDVLLQWGVDQSVILLNGLDAARVELTFADGSSMSHQELLERLPFVGKVLLGDDVDNELIGTSLTDTIIGGGGNDDIQGRAGDDLLRGGNGLDTYVFSRGDGVDTIEESADGLRTQLRFAENITPADLAWSSELVDGVMHVRIAYSETDAVRMKQESDWRLIDLLFAGGATMNGESAVRTQLTQALNLVGTANDDVLMGWAGADTLTGLAGNDVLDAGAGDDVLSGGAGSNRLLGGQGQDRFVVGATGERSNILDIDAASVLQWQQEGTAISNIKLHRAGADLVLTDEAGVSSATLERFFSFSNAWTLQLPDGTTHNLRDWVAQMEVARTDAQRKQAFYERIAFGEVSRFNANFPSGVTLSTEGTFVGEVAGNRYDLRITSDRITESSNASEIVLSRKGEVEASRFDIYRTEEIVQSEQVLVTDYIDSIVQLAPARQKVIAIFTPSGIGFGYSNDINVELLSDGRIKLTRNIPAVEVASYRAVSRWETVETVTYRNFYETQSWQKVVTQDLEAGDGNNRISLTGASALVDAGGGDDRISREFLPVLGPDDELIRDTSRYQDHLFGAPGEIDTRGNWEVTEATDLLHSERDAARESLGDWIAGGAGNDEIHAGRGSDELSGGVGFDLLSGNAGSDLYVVSASDSAGDLIIDKGTVTIRVQLLSETSLNAHLVQQLSSIGQLRLKVDGKTGSDWAKNTAVFDIALSAHSLAVLQALDRYASSISSNHQYLMSTQLDQLIERVTGDPAPTENELRGYRFFDPPAPARPSFPVSQAMSFIESLTPIDRLKITGQVELTQIQVVLRREIIGGETHDVAHLSWPGGSVRVAMDESSSRIGFGIERLEFDSGLSISLPEFLAGLSAGQISDERGSGVNYSEQTLNAVEDSDFEAQVVAPDTLIGQLSYTLDDSQSQLSWLKIDASTGLLSGRPGQDFVGEQIAWVRAYNASGDFVMIKINLKVAPTNDAPTAVLDLENVVAVAGEEMRWSIPQDLFADTDSTERLTLFVSRYAEPSALTSEAWVNDLPDWLTFDPVHRELIGTPPSTFSGDVNLQIVAMDSAGAIGSVPLRVTVPLRTFDLMGSSESDLLQGGQLGDTLDGMEGDDRLYGHGGDDVLTGRAGDDWLDGGNGADTMIGGGGNDTYVVDHGADIVTETSSQGIDMVQSGISYTLGAHLENLRLLGLGHLDGTGNSLVNRLEGNAGDNKLGGGAGNDTLLGMAGDDWLRGGTGADQMLGGAGDDLYEVDNVGDQIIELANEGIDTVEANISFTLSDHVENLILTGTAVVDATGNTLDNILQGNSAANILYGLDGNDQLNGRLGADILYGGKGDDTYFFEDDVDTVIELADEGRDVIISRYNLTLVSEVEDGVLSGSAVQLTGNALANVLTGNAAANTLDGGIGADVLIGGKGNDTYIVDEASDTVVELIGEGTDTVETSVNYALADNIENLTLTGNAEAGMGNALVNRIVGNAQSNKLWAEAGNDVIDGGAGADMMFGGLGNDTFYVDSTDDVVVEAAGEGIDRVLSSVSYALADHVENITLTGNANINAVGNAGNNTLEGNAGSNVLFGGLGSDTYRFGRGSGQDIIVNFDSGSPSSDRILLGQGIGVADIALAQRGSDLIMRIKDTSDQLTVANYFSNAGRGDNGLELIRFADGTSWRYSNVVALTTFEQGASEAQFLSPEVLSGNTSSLVAPIDPVATQPVGSANSPANVSDAIASNQARFEQNLNELRLSVDESGTTSRGSFVQSSTLTLLWNLQDALLKMQLAKNSDGAFTSSISLDGRALADLQRAVTFIGATPGEIGRLDSVTRIDQPAQFTLASFQ